MPIKDWPKAERPREKLLAKGANSLSDAELVAIFLRTGTQGKTAVEVARDLLKKFGSLHQLLNATEQDFCLHHGLGPAKYVQLQAGLELGKRFLRSKIEQTDILLNPTDTRNYVMAQMRGYHKEVFACLFLNNKNQIICFEKLFFGTINESSVYPREVVKMALDKNAAAVIFAHNHPSGHREASAQDIAITKRLKDALALVDIKVLDHFIIAGHTSLSFAEQGLL